MVSAAIANTALRSRRYCTGVTGTSAGRSGCLAVIADATVSCCAAYTAMITDVVESRVAVVDAVVSKTTLLHNYE